MESPVTPVWFMVIDHNFTCVLKGANYVDVPSDGLVYHFLKEIKALDWDTLKDTSGDLNVWKLRTSLPSKDVNQEYLANLKHLEIPEEGEEKREGKGKPKARVKVKREAKAKPKEQAEGEVAWLLKPDDKISLHFKELSRLETRIDVLVQIPARPGGTSCCAVGTRYQLIQLRVYSKRDVQLLVTYHAVNLVPAQQDEYPFKRRCLADDPDIPWLEEVHSKIWNKKDLEWELFRKVKVTHVHYTQLQERLKEQHPDRDSPDYDGRNHDVQSVKLDFLRSITPLSPLHPDNNELRVGNDDKSGASNEDKDGSVINSFFPFNLSFLDLSTLGLRKEVPENMPFPLFLRQEYDHISALIKKEPRNGQGSVIISGQPGTGEVLVSLSHRI